MCLCELTWNLEAFQQQRVLFLHNLPHPSAQTKSKSILIPDLVTHLTPGGLESSCFPWFRMFSFVFTGTGLFFSLAVFIVSLIPTLQPLSGSRSTEPVSIPCQVFGCVYGWCAFLSNSLPDNS